MKLVLQTSFVSTFSRSCKHFGIPKKCTFTWCTVPKIWFKNWPDDDFVGRNMSPYL